MTGEPPVPALAPVTARGAIPLVRGEGEVDRATRREHDPDAVRVSLAVPEGQGSPVALPSNHPGAGELTSENLGHPVVVCQSLVDPDVGGHGLVFVGADTLAVAAVLGLDEDHVPRPAIGTPRLSEAFRRRVDLAAEDEEDRRTRRAPVGDEDVDLLIQLRPGRNPVVQGLADGTFGEAVLPFRTTPRPRACARADERDQDLHGLGAPPGPRISNDAIVQ